MNGNLVSMFEPCAVGLFGQADGDVFISHFINNQDT
jgi:hypothetical protein